MSATELTSYPTASNSFDRYYDPKLTSTETRDLINSHSPPDSTYDYSCNQSPVRDCTKNLSNPPDDVKTACPLPADECWLFKPPNLQTMSTDSIQPITVWLRETFESPNSCFYRSRRNLLTRLEAILISGGETVAYRHSGSVPSLTAISTSQTSSRLHDKDDYPMTSRSLAYGPTAGSTDSLSLSGFRVEAPNPNFATFTRTKRTKPNVSLQNNPIPSASTGNRGSTSHLSSSVGVNPFSTRSANKTGSCDELERATMNADVQEIARMQEDHLKAEVAALVAASTAGRLGSQHSISSLNRLSPDGSCANIASAPESPHSSTTRLVSNTTNFESLQLNAGLRHTAFGSHSNEPTSQHYVSPYTPQFDLTQPQINPRPAMNPALYPKPNPYKLLPQKPVVNTTSMDSLGPDQFSSYAPALPPISGLQPNEVRNHFGFRAGRKNSNPVLSRPSVPTGQMSAVRRAVDSPFRFDNPV